VDSEATQSSSGNPLLIPVVEPPEKLNSGEMELWMRTECEKLQDEEGPSSIPTTAGEALALYLRGNLQELRRAEDEGRSAPARTHRLLKQSIIEDVTLDLLDNCQTSGDAPGPQLTKLIRSLLRADRHRVRLSREQRAWERAIWILAESPDIGIRELSRIIDVNASTVTRWHKNDEFQADLKRARTIIEKVKAFESGQRRPPDNEA
jgi:hypothetical protein